MVLVLTIVLVIVEGAAVMVVVGTSPVRVTARVIVYFIRDISISLRPYRQEDLENIETYGSLSRRQNSGECSCTVCDGRNFCAYSLNTRSQLSMFNVSSSRGVDLSTAQSFQTFKRKATRIGWIRMDIQERVSEC